MSTLQTYCRDCGTALRQDNPSDQCLECKLIGIHDRWVAAERARRREVVAQRLAQIDQGEIDQGGPHATAP